MRRDRECQVGPREYGRNPPANCCTTEGGEAVCAHMCVPVHLGKWNLILWPTAIHVSNLSRSLYHWICVLAAVREGEKCGGRSGGQEAVVTRGQESI